MLALNQNESTRRIRRFAAATAVLALACVASPSFAYAEVDVTPPVLAALTLPVQVPTGASGPDVTISARITDDLSGVAASDAQTACPAGPPRTPTYISLRSPSHAVFGGFFGSSGGDRYESVVQLPRLAQAGTWTVDLLSLTDCAGNTRYLRSGDLAAAGFPSSFTLRGEGDGTPPRLWALAFDPPSVDNTSEAVTITVAATITDDLSGVASHDRAATCGSEGGPVSSVAIRSPSGNQMLGNNLRHVSGDMYETTFPVPRYSEAGTWTAQVILVDCAHNFVHLEGAELHIPHVTSTLQVTGSTDTTPPFPRRLSITPTIVRAGVAGADVVLRATLDDDLSGVLTASGPTGCNASESVAIVTSPSGARLRAGFVPLTLRDFSATVSLPGSAAPGTWTVRLELSDCAGNVRLLGPSDLTALGLPNSFQVLPEYVFGGFKSPLHATELAHRKPGSAMAVKFRLGGAQGLDIFEADYPRVQPIDCMTRQLLGDAVPLGPTQWVFQDLTDGLFQYKWKSSPDWQNVCRRLILGFEDGSRYSADVLFK